MLKEILWKICNDCKDRIIITLITVGIVIAMLMARMPKPKESTAAERISEWCVTFDNLEDALEMFKELEGKCDEANKGEVAIFSGAAGKYVVIGL